MDEKKYCYCANCGQPLGDTYYYFSDNYLQVKYFEEMDGSDNAFCCETCACESLMLEIAENRKDCEEDI